MIFTSIFNIVYFLQRSFSKNINENIQIIEYNTIQPKNTSITPEKADLFQDFYQNILKTFSNTYIPLAENRTVLPTYCPPVPPSLLGPLAVNPVPKNFSLSTNSSYYPDIKLGGYYKPENCIARHKIAIIVPYRDRHEILKHFLFHTHQILQRQQLDYRIYICEQAFNKTFNKGIVMNACFKEILRLEPDTPCFIMHDVDLLLIDDRNMYTCPIYPRHLSVAIDKFHFYLPYPSLVGGVLGK